MWTWKQLTDSATDVLLRPNMKALEGSLRATDKYLTAQSVARTTDATVTTLQSIAIPINHTVVVTGHVAARRTGGASGAANDGAGYVVEFVAKNTAGTAALIGSGTVTALGESVAGWDTTLSASTDNVLVRVTGAAGTNITWLGSFKSLAATD